MSPSTRRIVIPLVVLAAALGVVLSIVFRKPPAEPADDGPPTAATVEPAAPDGTTPPDAAAEGTEPAVTDDQETGAPSPAATPQTVMGDEPLGALRAVPDGDDAGDPTWTTIGSLDPRDASMRVELTPAGAGISRIVLADQWETAPARHRADAHYAALAAGDADPPPLPDESQRYVLTEAHAFGAILVPVLAAHAVSIGSQDVGLLLDANGVPVEWAPVGPGSFRVLVEDEQGRSIVRITRTFVLGERYDIVLRQSVENLTDSDLDVKWKQWGPTDLVPDRARYMDRRRFRFGYLQPPEREPSRELVFAEPKLMIERADVVKQDEFLLWPNDVSSERGYVLSWFASTNRYFALAVHPLLPDPEQSSREITGIVDEIGKVVTAERAEDATIFSQLFSPPRTVLAGQSTDFDLGVFAGPQDRDVLAKVQPFKSLGMDQLILYQMSSCCAVCTFQWLAQFLMRFLSWVEFVVGDWGVAIIVLVCFVRLLLHPLTKRAQINMHRFSKSMTAMKPELERLQTKYKDEPKKFQAEQIRLMREHGVSPLQFLGCLPMFLQTPIWIALYAMLYFAFEIRQVPAFYGIFQKVSAGNWPFLADLSSADHFFGMFEEPASFLFWNVTGINLLPILMGVIFFVQQKYMSPPPSPTMTKEQIQQQKIMKIMMVVMFPLMLYSAPSGLTLYILTSSCIGILESRHVRKHVDELDTRPPSEKAARKSKSRDAMGRAYAAALERAEAKRRQRQQPKRSYKKRKK
ncbi:MAG: YidC/Oxa1 family insertase periplasmic-domain containing protein [Planctomycetota bacterium]|jgi:YidC/Oxa1 family membrane protein insertase